VSIEQPGGIGRRSFAGAYQANYLLLLSSPGSRLPPLDNGQADMQPFGQWDIDVACFKFGTFLVVHAPMTSEPSTAELDPYQARSGDGH
jgi:hypothetical protein